MSGRLLILIVLLSLVSGPQLIQAHPSLFTGNQFVWAEVDDSTGWISFAQGPVTDRTLGGPSYTLSHKEGSFLSLLINGTAYTNHCEWGAGVPGLLSNGKTSQIKDTLRTIWLQGGCYIIQDVYPVAFLKSGQIVLRVSVINLTGKPLAVQAQYLLDDEIDGIVQPKYGARSLTQYDRGTSGAISSVDVSFPPFGFDSITPPPFFMAFSQVAQQTSYLGNVVGVGYLTEELAPAPMGLMKPMLFAIGDVNRIEGRCSWGTPIYAGESYSDEAMLIVWPHDTLAASGVGATAIIGSTSYGTGEYEVCDGNVTAITFFPRQVQWIEGKLIPNNFTVESLIFGDTLATLSVSGQHRIVAPLPLTSGGVSQSQPLIRRWSNLTYARWKDSIFASSDTTIFLTLALSGGTSPAFTNVCSLPITIVGIPSQSMSLISTISRTGSFDGSLCNTRCTQAQASDPRLCMTCFVRSVSAIALQNMTFNVTDSTSWKFSVCVIDSMKNGSATVIALDGTGEMDTAYYTYCTIRDLLPPRLIQGNCKQGVCFYVDESRPWDRGLDSIAIFDVVNLNVGPTPPGSPRGLSSVFITGLPVDFAKPSSFCLQAFDLAGNKTVDTCFGMTSSVSTEMSQPLSLSVFPNPVTGILTIQLNGADAANVEVLDILGRTVQAFRMSQSTDWDASKIGNGTYIVRATAGGQTVSKRIIKE